MSQRHCDTAGAGVYCGGTVSRSMICDVARRGRVLVVEDDDTLRALLQEVLAGEGYAADGAADGAAALARATQAPPDLVLLDLHTPGLPAGEFVRRYRAGTPAAGAARAASIILVSG